MDRTLPYYKWFWQDWRANRKIQRMSYIERGLYRELLDECWVEGSIPNDVAELADICNCPVDVMADAWQVLSSCFVFIDGLLVNEKLHSLRTEKDIERLKKAENGKKGGIAKASAKQVPSSCHIEEKRREEKIKEEKIKTKDLMPEGMNISLWSDFLTLRKAKKLPITQTALNGIEKEAQKAGKSLADAIQICCERGWAGFKAEWLKTAPEKQDKMKNFWLQIEGEK
ncbi:Protein of unknown function DUF1376 [uncultured Caudovirales phage]|uniref:DUF1376 domain-containing protein n=1 Tax=uncultured Caudovirales phage TaxID=2100421 RepID=A0A6J5KJZ1_9CAUD|nr:Protein of unknown function DUF1376 [uncultured Caudovirales phage]